MSPRLHVIGGGLSGLAAAYYGLKAGYSVDLYEASSRLGGRFYSRHCPRLQRTIDNGTHLMLGANRHLRRFFIDAGAASLIRPLPVRFPLLNCRTRLWQQISPFSWPMTWREILRAMGRGTGSVAENLSYCPNYDDVWSVLAASILNTPAEKADFQLFARVLRRIFLTGPWGMRPYVFPAGQSTIIDKITKTITHLGGRIHLNHRIRLDDQDAYSSSRSQTIPPGPNRRIIWAIPPTADCPVNSIINLHFRLTTPPDIPGNQPFAMLSNGLAHWVSLREDILSVTISAANDLTGDTDLVRQVWQQIQPLTGGGAIPPHRVIKEKRATLSHGWMESQWRPPLTTADPQILRAGDWIQGPWPCTMEGAILSSKRAIGRLNGY